MGACFCTSTLLGNGDKQHTFKVNEVKVEETWWKLLGIWKILPFEFEIS